MCKVKLLLDFILGCHLMLMKQLVVISCVLSCWLWSVLMITIGHLPCSAGSLNSLSLLHRLNLGKFWKTCNTVTCPRNCHTSHLLNTMISIVINIWLLTCKMYIFVSRHHSITLHNQIITPRLLDYFATAARHIWDAWKVLRARTVRTNDRVYIATRCDRLINFGLGCVRVRVHRKMMIS